MDGPPPAYANAPPPMYAGAAGGGGEGKGEDAGPPQQQAIKLWDSAKERRKYNELADLYAVIKSTEALEKAYIRDLVDRDRYTELCNKLIAQFKGAELALNRDKSIGSTEDFMKQYVWEERRREGGGAEESESED